jgi:hypothetical protein
MSKKPLTQEQRDYLKPALDKLDAAFNELQAQLQRLPPNGDPFERTGCLRCDCSGYQGDGSLCTNKGSLGKCAHSMSVHADRL